MIAKGGRGVLRRLRDLRHGALIREWRGVDSDFDQAFDLLHAKAPGLLNLVSEQGFQRAFAPSRVTRAAERIRQLVAPVGPVPERAR